MRNSVLCHYVNNKCTLYFQIYPAYYFLTFFERASDYGDWDLILIQVGLFTRLLVCEVVGDLAWLCSLIAANLG